MAEAAGRAVAGGRAPVEAVSVLLAVWGGDRADWVRAALESLRAQTRAADQVVVVQDGPIPPELSAVLAEFDGPLPVERVVLAENRGLGPALQAGILACRHELIARTDSDDINVPERLERQATVMTNRPELAVLGGYVAEFIDDPSNPYAVREVPIGTTRTARVARWRSPVNHPAVMFRRSAVLAVGGYDRFIGIEDYYLWGKLLAAGYHLDNLPEVLVRQRAGTAMSDRRGGWLYVRREAALFRSFVQIGFLTRREAAVGLAVRIPVRLLPRTGRHWFYTRVLRRRV